MLNTAGSVFGGGTGREFDGGYVAEGGLVCWKTTQRDTDAQMWKFEGFKGPAAKKLDRQAVACRGNLRWRMNGFQTLRR